MSSSTPSRPRCYPSYAVLSALTIAIGRRFTRAPLLANFRRLVALQFTAAAAFTAFIVLQFLTK
jgi:hypothetical protein